MESSIQVKSYKAFIEEIKSLGHIECELDNFEVQELARSYDIINYPDVENDSGLLKLIPGRVCYDFGLWLDHYHAASILTVKIFGLTFSKRGPAGRWYCENAGAFKGTESGFIYNEEKGIDELRDACLEMPSCDPDGDEWDLLSAALDRATDAGNQFPSYYRMCRTYDEDAERLTKQIKAFDYEGYYLSLGGIYGWRRGDENPWPDFDPTQLFDAEVAAWKLLEN